MIRAWSYCACALLILISWGCNTDDGPGGSNTNSITLIQTFGGANNDSGQSVVATSDGGYAILGFTQSNDGDITDKQDESFDYWVLKFDAQDNLQWQKTYGGDGDDRGREIIQTQDGGYAILGFSFSASGDVTENAGLQDFWLAKLDAFDRCL